MVGVVFVGNEVAVIVQMPYPDLIAGFVWLYLLPAQTANHVFTSLQAWVALSYLSGLARSSLTPNGARRQSEWVNLAFESHVDGFFRDL